MLNWEKRSPNSSISMLKLESELLFIKYVHSSCWCAWACACARCFFCRFTIRMSNLTGDLVFAHLIFMIAAFGSSVLLMHSVCQYVLHIKSLLQVQSCFAVNQIRRFCWSGANCWNLARSSTPFVCILWHWWTRYTAIRRARRSSLSTGLAHAPVGYAARSGHCYCFGTETDLCSWIYWYAIHTTSLQKGTILFTFSFCFYK